MVVWERVRGDLEAFASLQELVQMLQLLQVLQILQQGMVQVIQRLLQILLLQKHQNEHERGAAFDVQDGHALGEQKGEGHVQGVQRRMCWRASWLHRSQRGVMLDLGLCGHEKEQKPQHGLLQVLDQQPNPRQHRQLAHKDLSSHPHICWAREE